MYFGGLKVDTDPVDAVRLVSLVGDATSNEFQSLIKKQFVNGNDGAERLLAEITQPKENNFLNFVRKFFS